MPRSAGPLPGLITQPPGAQPGATPPTATSSSGHLTISVLSAVSRCMWLAVTLQIDKSSLCSVNLPLSQCWILAAGHYVEHQHPSQAA